MEKEYKLVEGLLTNAAKLLLKNEIVF